ncbi:hypothetical protein REPUB_Repub17cG0026500 [Reevesia pubescens]
MGRAINKTVTIVELIKRRIVGLHQITSIGSTDITDMWEPLEEGLLPLETTRRVSMITVTLMAVVGAVVVEDLHFNWQSVTTIVLGPHSIL